MQAAKADAESGRMRPRSTISGRHGATPILRQLRRRIGQHVGQRDLAVTANTYTHVMSDEVELDYAAMMWCVDARIDRR